MPNKDKRTPKTGYEGEENVNCWVVDGLWLKSIYQRRGAPSSVRFVSAIILQSFSFFLQNTYDRKRKYFVLRAPAQHWSLKLYFFQNNHMKTFSVAFTGLKCSEILSIVLKKDGEPFFESLTFASAMIYQNEVRTKHLRMLIFYSAMDDPSLLRRTIILFR